MRLSLPIFVALAGCPPKESDLPALAAAAPRPTAPPISSPPSDLGLRTETVDFNGDGRAEVINWYGVGGNLARKGFDHNADGRVDVMTFYTVGGQIEREEMDQDFDGQVDWVDHYQGGARVKAEADTDYDGRIDVVFHYEGGQVVKKERFGENI